MLVAAVAVAFVRPDPAPVVAAPTPDASEPAPPASPTPAATPSERRRDPVRRPGRPVDFTELAREVAAIRGLDVRRRVRARLVSNKGLADKVGALVSEDLDTEQIEADRRLLVALRFAEPDLDLAEVLQALYREQILGVYVPEEGTLYVRHGPDDLTAAGALTAVHEITHALQDQHYDLETLRERVEDDADAALAVLSLIEGDAVLTQGAWSQAHQTDAERERAAVEGRSSSSDALARTPTYLQNSLFFPYSDGVSFVAALHREGGYAAVDRAFTDPPSTSEHILHPDRYLAGEGSDDVRVGVRPGGGYEASTDYEFGEFDVAELFAPLGASTASGAADGWAGGEVRSWTRGDATATALALTFDDEQEAGEACDLVAAWYRTVADGADAGDGLLRGDRDVMAYRCDGRRVQIGLAAEPDTARRLAGA